MGNEVKSKRVAVSERGKGVGKRRLNCNGYSGVELHEDEVNVKSSVGQCEIKREVSKSTRCRKYNYMTFNHMQI